MANGLLRYREGSVTVTVSGDLAEYVQAVIDSTADTIADRLRNDVTAIYQHAYEEWPVKTGRSRDGLTTTFTLDASLGRLEAKILGLTVYTVYIKPKKLGGKTTAWQEWVRGPMHALRKALTAELGDQIVQRTKKRRG